jgi:acetyl-CoA carboxylase carboxyltransferase component
VRGRRPGPPDRGGAGRGQRPGSPSRTRGPQPEEGGAAQPDVSEPDVRDTGAPGPAPADAGPLLTVPVQTGRTEGVLTAAALTQSLAAQPGKSRDVVVRTGSWAEDGRPVVTARVQRADRGWALPGEAGAALASAAGLALERRLPLVAWLSSPGLDLNAGVAALDGWGRAARALARCSGVVPVVIVLDGPALSGSALLLGMADAVVMTPTSLAYLSGPAAVAEVTGFSVRPNELGGQQVHASRSGLATFVATDDPGAVEAVKGLLGFLPAHCDELPPVRPCHDPTSRPTPELRDVVPATSTGSYDVRRVLRAVADEGQVFELRASWAPQIVTALVHVGGRPVGVLANQPQAMAGTVDIAASQKGARFVAFCDSFNLPLLTVVDTPGFMPGRDLEWRGIIRHGAELVFAYAEATVPRICLVVRKAYGGAYIVMDSKAMGNDLCVAWPSAELAVLGAEQAVKIVHRREDEETQAKLAVEYGEKFLNPYIAAERGYVDLVIDPAQTRQTIARSLAALQSKRERLVARKHGNSPL